MYFKGMQLCGTEAQGDHILFTHMQDVVPVMAMANEMRKHTDNGWNVTRTMQCLGDIPHVVFFNHPEFYNDDAALRRWLNSDEGQPYRVGHMKHRNETSNVRVK